MGAWLSGWHTDQLPEALSSWPALSSYFGADVARVATDLADPNSQQSRANVHPLFALLACGPTQLAAHVLGDSATAIRGSLAFSGGLWAAGLFALLRLLGFGRLDACLAVSLGLASATTVFWSGVPESHVFASASLVLGLAALALSERRRVGLSWHAAAMVGTAAFTVTNALPAVLASSYQLSLRRFAMACLAAVIGFSALWGVQSLVYPTADSPLEIAREGRFIRRPRLADVEGFWVVPMVASRAGTAEHTESRPYPKWTMRSSSPFAQPWPAATAAILWCVLLALGIKGIAPSARRLGLLRAALGALAFQGFLHSFYGDEPFLYAANFFPLLLLLVAQGLRTPYRAAVRVGMLLTALLALGHNLDVRELTLQRYLEPPAPGSPTRASHTAPTHPHGRTSRLPQRNGDEVGTCNISAPTNWLSSARPKDA